MMHLTMNKDHHLLVSFAMMQTAYVFASKCPHGSANGPCRALTTQSRDRNPELTGAALPIRADSAIRALAIIGTHHPTTLFADKPSHCYDSQEYEHDIRLTYLCLGRLLFLALRRCPLMFQCKLNEYAVYTHQGRSVRQKLTTSPCFVPCHVAQTTCLLCSRL